MVDDDDCTASFRHCGWVRIGKVRMRSGKVNGGVTRIRLGKDNYTRS